MADPLIEANRRINEKPGMCHVRVRNAEQSLSFCHLAKQRLINDLADGVNERYGRHDDSSPDYRPKFRVFTEKANRGVKVAEFHHVRYLFGQAF